MKANILSRTSLENGCLGLGAHTLPLVMVHNEKDKNATRNKKPQPKSGGRNFALPGHFVAIQKNKKDRWGRPLEWYLSIVFDLRPRAKPNLGRKRNKKGGATTLSPSFTCRPQEEKREP